VTRREYLREVERRLRDVPWKRRKELLAKLAAHLDETPADQLDAPLAYAAELRASARLPRRRGVIAFLRARRPRNLVIVGMLLVVVALLASGLVWVSSYQPIVRGNSGLDPPVSQRQTTETLATFRDGKPFLFGMTVRNDGAFTIRVEDVPLVERPAVQPFSGRIMMSSVLKHDSIYPPYMPFRPFDLKPGQERLLYFTGRYANCRDFAGNSEFVMDSLPVTFTFLWNRQTVRLPLFEPVVIQVPAGRRCRPKS
jgi:hypothetical protein